MTGGEGEKQGFFGRLFKGGKSKHVNTNFDKQTTEMVNVRKMMANVVSSAQQSVGSKPIEMQAANKQSGGYELLSPNPPMAKQELNMSPLYSLNVEAAAAASNAASRKPMSAAFQNINNFGGLVGPKGILPTFTEKGIKAYGNSRQIALSGPQRPFGPQRPLGPPPAPPVAQVAPRPPPPPVAPRPKSIGNRAAALQRLLSGQPRS
jgi:hypothetical protein